MKKIITGLCIAIAAGTAFATSAPKAELVPDEKILKRFALNVHLAAERPQYTTSVSASATRINGFKDYKTCWSHAHKIAQVLAKAAEDAGDDVGATFSCDEVDEFLE